MKKLGIIFVGTFCFTSAAFAQNVVQKPQMQEHQESQKIEMVTVPRQLVQAALQYIAKDPAVQIFTNLLACFEDNPDHGIIHHSGPDACPSVTAALATSSTPTPTSTLEKGNN